MDLQSRKEWQLISTDSLPAASDVSASRCLCTCFLLTQIFVGIVPGDGVRAGVYSKAPRNGQAVPIPPPGVLTTTKASPRPTGRRRSHGVVTAGGETCVFLGLDLAWKVDGNNSAIAVLTGDEHVIQLKTISDELRSLLDIESFVEAHSGPTTVLAVDASLVVKNVTGQRRCETLIGKLFGRYHASCHTTNLARPYAPTGERLIGALKSHGFVHDFDLDSTQHRGGRWLFETYPHPSMVRLFDLNRIIAYKKGAVAKKRAGLRTLQNHLLRLKGLRKTAHLRELLHRDVATLKGRTLKQYEDRLDALFCAYVAWHCWKWGPKKNEMYGSMEDGYIVVAMR